MFIIKKKAFLAAAFAFAYAGVFARQAPDPLEGCWLSVNNKGVVESGWEIYLDGGALCGRLLSGIGWAAGDIAVKCRSAYRGFPAPGKVNEMQVLGSPWIFGLQREESGRWTNGFVIDPSNGNIYKCKLIHHPADGKRYKTETMEMRGEIGLGIGASQNWRRATRAEAASLR
jgi:uncharacterized protein (DUF2147 family)